jgi:hypothetical protein
MSCGTLFTQTTKNGVREVRMPKTEEAKIKPSPSKSIKAEIIYTANVGGNSYLQPSEQP